MPETTGNDTAITMAGFNKMNRLAFQLLLSLVLLSLWFGSSAASDADIASASKFSLGTLPLQKVHVHVQNGIPGKNLFVHCHSNDNLGEHQIPFNQNYDINFKVDFFGTTSFKCNMWWFNDRGVKKWQDDMLIYNYDRDVKACGNNNCYRAATPDGVYIDGKFTYAWNG